MALGKQRVLGRLERRQALIGDVKKHELDVRLATRDRGATAVSVV